MIDYAARRARVIEALDVDAFLVVHLETTDPDRASIFYLTGYPGYGVLLLTRDATHAYASPTNIGMASEAAPHLDWRLLDWEYQEAILALIKEHEVRRLGVASRRIGMLTWRALEAANAWELVVEDDPIAAVRAVKDADEIEAIRRAAQITESALEEVLARVGPGATEAQIAWWIECAMRERGADQTAFDLIVSAGASSALPHHDPADRPIRDGEVLLFDIGARYRGYCSDITRVVSIGRAAKQMREIYGVVLEANRAGIEAFEPGASGATVEAAARNVIEEAGYGEAYTHGLSHGVGIEIHELPVSQGSRAIDAYQPGMVCTAEPGIYLSGVGGIRIEDLLVVTDDGCEVLSRFPKDRLVEVG